VSADVRANAAWSWARQRKYADMRLALEGMSVAEHNALEFDLSILAAANNAAAEAKTGLRTEGVRS